MFPQSTSNSKSSTPRNSNRTVHSPRLNPSEPDKIHNALVSELKSATGCHQSANTSQCFHQSTHNHCCQFAKSPNTHTITTLHIRHCHVIRNQTKHKLNTTLHIRHCHFNRNQKKHKFAQQYQQGELQQQDQTSEPNLCKETL